MARKHHKPEEIVAKLRQVEVLVGQGKPIAEGVQAIGVTEATYYRCGATGAPGFPYVRLHFGQGHARRAVVTLQDWRSNLILHRVVPPPLPTCLPPRLSAASK